MSAREHRRSTAPVHLGLVLAVALAQAAGAEQIGVEMWLEPDDAIGLYESVLLRLKVDSPGVLQGTPAPEFQLDNLEIVAGPSQSSSLRIVNGVPSRSITLTWQLRAGVLGRARIHGGLVRIGKEAVEVADLEVEVLEGVPASRRARQRATRRPRDPFADPFGSSPFDRLFEPRRPRRGRSETVPEIFLHAEAEPRNPYVGQQVLYTLYLFTQADIRSVNPAELPTFKGFWARDIPQPDQLEPQMVRHDGERFGKVVLLQRALFPRRAGKFTLDPIEATMGALLPDSGPFGSILPRTREVSRTSNTIEIEVRDLPPPPLGFAGAVGRLALTAELAPRELEVGEAATLTLTLKGQGHLQGLPAPILPELPDIEVFPPQQQSGESVRRKHVSGRRTWSFVLVPRRSGSWPLPPIEVPYFDPHVGRYRTASAADLELTVRGSTRATPESGQTVELHPIRTAALPAVGGRGGSWSAAQPWLFAVPWGLAAVLFWVRRRGQGGAHGHKQLLARLRRAVEEAQPRQAAARMEEAWRDYLETRWNIPQGSPSTRWGTLLSEHGVAAQYADALVQLADDLHYLRYAPKLSSTDEIRSDLVERSRKLVRALR